MVYYFSFIEPLPRLRVRPSFPTRRSSDLSKSENRFGRGFRLGAYRGVDGRGDGVEVGGGRAHQPQLRRLDRKSTRLNSSHEWISYAVFCLKKKNEEGARPNVIAIACAKQV